jgi:hypothetical protein
MIFTDAYYLCAWRTLGQDARSGVVPWVSNGSELISVGSRQYAYGEVWSCLGVSPKVNQPRTSFGFFFSMIKRPGTLLPFFSFTLPPTIMSYNELQPAARCPSYDDVVVFDQADTIRLPTYKMSYLSRDHPYGRWNSHRRHDCVKVSQYLVRYMLVRYANHFSSCSHPQRLRKSSRMRLEQ